MATTRAGGGARRAAFTDLRRWLRLCDLVDSLQPDGPPAARALPPGWTAPARLGVLAGSFNPLTRAHTELVARAQRETDLESVAFALSVRTVDKERVTGLMLEDRLICLEIFCQHHSAHGALLLNRGLYVDQAVALRDAYPTVRDLTFIVGYDKIIQIFDSRYYADRDADLERLFGLARLLVAPRAGQGRAALDALLDRPENRRFAGGVGWLPLPDSYADLSATQVRQEVSHGRMVEAVPVETRAMLAVTRAYQTPRQLASGEVVDDYALRLALLSTLAATRAWAETRANLPALLRLAGAPGRTGRELRAWLANPPFDETARVRDLTRFQARLGQ